MIELFRAQLGEISETGTADVRLIPYGEPIDHGRGMMQFDRGSISYEPVHVNLDHGEGPLDRIGMASSIADTAEGLYAKIQFADTQQAQDVRALMAVGAITDVSAGVLVDLTRDHRDANGITHKFGALDHIAIVGRGAFGESGAGSKVLAVHSKGDPNMDQVETAPEVEPTETEMALMTKQLTELRSVVTELSIPGSITQPVQRPFKDKRDFILTLAAAQKGDSTAIAKMEQFVLADDTTTTAIGVVPDFLSTKVLEIVDTSRPYVETLVKDDIGSHGMSVVYPSVISGPTVAVQAAQKTEVESTAMNIDPVSIALATYAGASDVARQLIERSQPSFVDILFRHYASAYAQTTDAAAVAAGVAGAGDTAILADLGASGAVTYQAFLDASMAVLAGVRKPATHACLAIDRWSQLLSLVDSDGRPLIVFPPNGPDNAQGTGDFTSMTAQYAGLQVYVDPNAATGSCLIYNAEEYAGILEQSPVQLRAEVVSLLGFEMGVYGLFAHALHQAGAGSTLTLA